MTRETMFTKIVAWLICAVMIIGMIPSVSLPASAAGDEWEGDIDVAETTEPPTTAPPAGSEANPIMLTAMENAVANAGAVYYATFAEGTIMTITGPAEYTVFVGEEMFTPDEAGAVSMPIVGASRWAPFVFQIDGDGDFQINFAYPEGHMENPAVAYLGYNCATIAEGSQGFFFNYVADYTGTLIVEVVNYDGGWSYVINNMTTYAYGDTQWSDSDPVVNPAEIEVTAGDEIQIIVNTYDSENRYVAPAGSVEVNLSYPAGTEANPIMLTEMSNAVTNAGTVYYQSRAFGTTMTISGDADYIVFVNGEMYEPDENGEVSMPVEGAGFFAPPFAFQIEGDGEFQIDFVYPVGHMENPAAATLGDNVANTAAGSQGYFMSYIAEKDGTLIVTISGEENWTYTINNMTTYAYGDTQWSDSDPVVNPAEIAVKAGDEIQIIVNGYDPANPWEAPAANLNVNLAYKPEGPAIAEDLVFLRTNTSGGDLMLGDDIRASFMVQPNGYSNIYVEVTKDGVTSNAEKLDISSDSMFYFAYVVPAAQMTEDIILTIYGEKDGVTYRGEELVYSVRKCAEAKLGLWINNPATANMCRLLMNMLYYGELAQLQFSVNTDNLATAGLPEEYLALITTEEPSLKGASSVDETGMAATLLNMGFMLQEKVKLSVYFNVTGGVSNADEYYVEVKHISTMEGVDPVTYTYTSEDFEVVGGVYILFFFDKIAPARMRDNVEYTLYRNGEAVSATYVRSMEMIAYDYVNRAPALADLIYAIMNYADAAKVVFG